VEISPTNHGTKLLHSLMRLSDPWLVQVLKMQNITAPTTSQAHGIPLLQKGYDIMGSAQTGTSKTLMFCIPICEQLLQSAQATKHHSTKGPSALILNPTKEHAIQMASAL
jgi:superfamily II DNA/RNA helicase